MPRVDYDQIAHLYDEPLRDHQVDVNLVALLGERPDLPPARACMLDVGCGTGKQLSANRARFPNTFAVGLDRFAGMLRIARKRCPDIAWVQGDGSEMPLRSASFDYACNQFSYHHIRNKAGLVREVLRVLRPGGRFAITNIDPWSMQGWILYEYFPAARDRDYRDFVTADALVALMREAGFINVHAVRDGRLIRENLPEFLAYARQRHRASQLIALPDEDYRAGIGRLEGAVADAKGDQVAVGSEFCLLTITGAKPQVADRGGKPARTPRTPCA